MHGFYGFSSFAALPAFEAAARHLSLSEAAREMDITTGAVSKQIRALESELGHSLFLRDRRRLRLTRAGATLARGLQEGFGRISTAFQQISGLNAFSGAVVGSSSAVAHLWLMPRLTDFWSLHPNVLVTQVVSDRSQRLDRSDIDIRIRYGNGNWPGETAQRLFDDRISPVASPEFLRRHIVNSIEKLTESQLLSAEDFDDARTNWPDFFRHVGLATPKLNIRRFGSYEMALHAAREGKGVALGWLRLTDPWIRQRLLQNVTETSMVARGSFFATWNADKSLGKDAVAFRNWLLTQV